MHVYFTLSFKIFVFKNQNNKKLIISVINVQVFENTSGSIEKCDGKN